jgi:hypothetical protein
MWMEKLLGGVLCVLTPLGARYVKPTFWQRLYLMWIFRNFQTLPPQVLSTREQRLIDRLCASQRFAAVGANPFEDAPVLGIVERRPDLPKSKKAAKQAAESPSSLVRQRP